MPITQTQIEKIVSLARSYVATRTPLDLVPLGPPSRFTKHIESKGRIILCHPIPIGMGAYERGHGKHWKCVDEV